MCLCAPSLVFPGVEQLPSAAQTAADRNASAEQPGGAFPPAQLPHAREVQVRTVENPSCSLFVGGHLASFKNIYFYYKIFVVFLSVCF